MTATVLLPLVFFGGGGRTPGQAPEPSRTAQSPVPILTADERQGDGGGKTRLVSYGAAKTEISVATAFQSGATKKGVVDIAYNATPRTGMEITHVSYSINGGVEEYVYLRGGNGITPKGTLGNAKVMLAPGENHIVFTVKDNTGATSSYAVPGAPAYDFGITPDRSKAQLAQSSIGGGVQYVTNQIIVVAKNNATDDQVANAAAAINGIVVGQVNPVGMYWMQIPGQHSEAQLKSLCSQLLADHPDIVAAASPDRLIPPIDLPRPVPPGGASPNANATTDPWWGNGEWGLTAMNVP